MGRLRSIAQSVSPTTLWDHIRAGVMPNTNYLAGRRLEYEVKKVFEAQGYHVIRASGSHGLYDLVCIRSNQIILVQCKLCADASTAAKLRVKWGLNPPFQPFNFPATQVLATKIKGSSAIFYVNV